MSASIHVILAGPEGGQQTDQQINKAASTQIHLLLFFWISSLLPVRFSGLSTVTLLKAF